MSKIRSNRRCSKVVGISSDIFGNVRKSSENRRKSSEVARTFSEIPVKTRQKSHAFDSEKVGRYTMFLLWKTLSTALLGLVLLYSETVSSMCPGKCLNRNHF